MVVCGELDTPLYIFFYIISKVRYYIKELTGILARELLASDSGQCFLVTGAEGPVSRKFIRDYIC